MTPVYFGYPTKNIIEEITKYYFDRDINTSIQLPPILETPTSNLIEICMESQLYGDPYEHYIIGLTKLIRELNQ